MFYSHVSVDTGTLSRGQCRYAHPPCESTGIFFSTRRRKVSKTASFQLLRIFAWPSTAHFLRRPAGGAARARRSSPGPAGPRGQAGSITACDEIIGRYYWTILLDDIILTRLFDPSPRPAAGQHGRGGVPPAPRGQQLRRRRRRRPGRRHHGVCLAPPPFPLPSRRDHPRRRPPPVVRPPCRGGGGGDRRSVSSRQHPPPPTPLPRRLPRG